MHLSHHPATEFASNDYHRLPVTEKQLAYARKIAARASLAIPDEVCADRRAMSAWIDAHRPQSVTRREGANHPSSKQVAFAERIARIKRRNVPPECFRDRTTMSRWIDSNR
ncbi:MAG TPA: hypothetical protein DEA05_13890 [Rhodobacteraceae bacterium]|nr:hypothetical protein [Paracoccaceae bacterium]